MSFRKREWSWLAVALFGAGAFVVALDYGFGTAANVGSGIYPLILAGVIVLVSLYSFAFATPTPAIPLAWRPMAAIVGSVLLFCLIVERFGLVPAVVLSMLVAYAAQTERGYGRFLAYAAVFAFGTWALFSYSFNLPLPMFRMP